MLAGAANALTLTEKIIASTSSKVVSFLTVFISYRSFFEIDLLIYE